MKLIQIAIKHCKKIVSLLLIMLMFLTSSNSIFANEEYKINDIQRNELIRQSEVINWNSFDSILNKKDNFIIIDYYTGY